MGLGKRKRRQFDRAFKVEAVKLSYQEGRGIVEVARNLGINETVLRRWRHELTAEGAEAFRGQGQRTADAEEQWRLQRELRKVTEERDILKKALAYFAEHQK
jgi:transposase